MHQFWSLQLWNEATPDGFYSLPIFCQLKPTRETTATWTTLPTFSVLLEGETAFPSAQQETEALCVLWQRTLCRSSSGSPVPCGDSPIHTSVTVALGCGFNSFMLLEQNLNQSRNMFNFKGPKAQILTIHADKMYSKIPGIQLKTFPLLSISF